MILVDFDVGLKTLATTLEMNQKVIAKFQQNRRFNGRKMISEPQHSKSAQIESL